jgi:predicted TIM-barrel fold metal-dependent hydrolase
MTMADRVRKGLPLDDILIIDCHNHIGLWKAFNVPYSSAEDMLMGMDRLGIDKVCVAAHASIGPNYRYGNDIVIDAVERYPDRFLGYVTVNPNYPEDMENELKRCLAINGFIGIKLHPECHGSAVDNINYNAAFELANEEKLPILIHIWGGEDVKAVDRLSGMYPDARFIMGHAGGDVKAMGHALDVVNRRDNVYVDIVISRIYEGNIEWFVREAGSKRVLFGTDMPFLDPRPNFGRVAMADISDEEKKDIFGLNMKRLIEGRVR